MQKIIAFSKYLSYMLGGAEKSTYEILKQESSINKIEIVSFNGIKAFGAKSKKTNFPEDWKNSYIDRVFRFHKFFYWEYLFNRSRLKEYFRTLNTNDTILYTYAIYAPIAINSFDGKTKLFIRSESDLGINRNYQKGIKKFLKKIYMILEYPAFQIYRNDLQKAINKSEVICNSKFMSKKLKEIYNKDSEILYPFIDEFRLKSEYKKLNNFYEKGIVFVGDSIIKGIDIVKSLAEIMQDEEFYIFSRFVNKEIKNGNINWMPWQKNEVDIYKYAKIVIVPSICEEAYGRVSREAYILEIPILVSNLGGLPESVNEEAKFIINDFKNIKEWKKRIENFK